jgi:EAL domain-containing protein (putative c-di-GMP-specific phosphodiesterase class I)
MSKAKPPKSAALDESSADHTASHPIDAYLEQYDCHGEQFGNDPFSMGRLLELKKAIEQQQLVLHYQPEVDMVTGSIIGFEALMRWQHPELGLLPPSEFIPLAEQSGLIVPLGHWCMKEACRQIREWRRVLSHRTLNLHVSVNLSARQFSYPGLLEEVQSILSKSCMEATQLSLEITESSLMTDADYSLNTLDELRRIGVGLQMDDFGTGYSSLNYLHRFPFDTLKIDRVFVQRMSSTNESSQIVRIIHDLARAMKMEVVAEGIETEEQAQMLRSLGCHYGQGYYFSRALDPHYITHLLSQSAPLPWTREQVSTAA